MSLPRFLMVLALALAGSNWCSGDEESLAAAHQAYKQGEFKRAYEAYSAEPHKSPAVFYNMGNCAFKLGQLGKALLHWRQAELDWGMGGHQELQENIALAQRLLAERSGQPVGLAEGPLLHRVHAALVSFVRMIPLVALQVTFLIFWILLFVYVRFLLKKKKRIIFLTFFCVLSAAGSLMVYKYSVRSRRSGIVLGKEVAIYSGPATTYQPIASLQEGDEVTVKNEVDNFYKIKTAQYLGWVAREAIGIV